MAMINCLECGKQISDKAEKCPQCGCTIRGTVDDGQVSNSTIYVGLGYSKADLGKRLGAYLLDGLIIGALCIPTWLYYSSVAGGSFDLYDVILLLVFAFLPLDYALLKDGFGKGQSWGKKAVGLMVVNLQDNTPCSQWRSCLRGVIGGVLSLIPFVGALIEPIMVLAKGDGRRLADLAASTQVIDVSEFE